tara:strand:+ start:61 stop:681 length:621 start_codon:yes stop_codon:yes gene_type:complete
MKILIACEYSGRVRDAFIAKGHDAMSCDLLPSDAPGPHYQGDMFDLDLASFDMIIAHPPCTYLSVSGLFWNKNNPKRAAKTDDALNFIKRIWELPVSKICIENPVGCINTRLDFMPKPQYIQPYDFGEDASKKTGLWTRGLPKLTGTTRIPGRQASANGKTCERWANQTDSGQNNLGPSPDRWKLRSTTYQGIANAMSEQWNNLEN